MFTKSILMSLAMFAISASEFASAQTINVTSATYTYKCAGYILDVTENSMVLQNEAANSKSLLIFAGPSSGRSNTLLMSGALVPVGMNILARVAVDVDSSLLEGSNSGSIAVGSEADPQTKVRFSCLKE